ncbi:MAG TPA: hypothetical protein VFG30_32915 [Polyangiales bacterium]|nr:hypothetical protein [Polyangiales bacterium]
MTTRLICMTLLALTAFGCSDDYGSTSDPAAQPIGYDGYNGGGYGETTPAPSPTPTAPANPDCAGSIPAYEDVAAFDKCVMCHDSMKAAGQRKSAPINVNFDTQVAADSHALQAVSMVKAGVMPPVSSGLTLTDAEKQQLYTWAMCSM